MVPPGVVASNTTPRPVKAIAAGEDICAIRADGTLGCWGGYESPPAGTFEVLDSAEGSVCAIRTSGELGCWGMIGTSVPEGRFKAVSVSQSRACAIGDDGELTCWSTPDEPSSEWGEDGSATEVPVILPAGPFRAVSLSESFDCGLRADGTLACWGEGSGSVRPAPGTKFTAIDAPCAITQAGHLTCFGGWTWLTGPGLSADDTYGALSLTSGRDRGCAIRTDGRLVCWGREGYDEAGNELAMRAPAGSFTSVTVGDRYACATRFDGRAVCWGDSDEYARPAPTIVFEPPPWVTSLKIPLRWGAISSFGAITSYDIDRVTAWDDEGYASSFAPWRVATTDRAGTFVGEPGKEYCWRARAHDDDGVASSWTGGCTAIPEDDTVLTRSRGWSTVRGKAYYLGRASVSTVRGATLSMRVNDWGVTIIATTCPTCGVIKAYVDGDLYETVNLRSRRTTHRRLVFWSNNGDEGFEDGALTIKVASSGRPVIIDGVLLGPTPGD